MAERNRRSIFSTWCLALSVFWLCTGMAVFGWVDQAAGAGTKTLAFNPQPTTPVFQSATWPQFAVRVLKSDGTLDNKNNKTKITLSLTSGATGVLSGTLTKTVAAGVATFTGLSYNRAETITLKATASDIAGYSKLSTPVTVLAPLASLEFNPQPATPVLQNAAWTQFAVRALRSDGTLDSGNNSTQITLSLTSGATGLSGTLVKTVAAGVATFTDIAYSQAGTISLKATASDIPGYSKFSNPVTALPPFAVTQVAPAEGAVNVPSTSAVSVTFNRDVLASGINAGTLFLSPSVAGSYTVAGNVATFTPASPLPYSTSFTATVTQGATDAFGNPLATAKTWSFTTAPAPLASLQFNPQPATPVLQNAAWTQFAVRALRSDGTLDSNNNSSLVTVSINVGLTSALTGTLTKTVTAGVATFTDISYSQAGTIYLKATSPSLPGYTALSNGILVTTPFVVNSVNPAANAVNVSPAATIVCYFNRAVRTSTVTSSSFFTNPYVPGTFTFSSNVATFTPSSPLSYNAVYTVTVTQAVTDTAGVPLSAPFVWSFTTATPPDWGIPVVISTGTGNNNVSYAGDTFGNGLAAWQKTAGQIGLYSNRLSSGQWGGEQLLARATTYIYPPQVAVGPDPMLAVWPDGNGPVSMFASEFQEPGGWSQTQNLGLAQTYPPPAVAAGNNQATALWISSAIGYASRWDAASNSFGPVTAISNTVPPIVGPQSLRVCQDGTGQSAVAIWHVNNTGNVSLVANRFADNAWGTPTVLASSVAMTSSGSGNIGCDGSGNTTVAWHSASTPTNLVPYTIRYEATPPLYPTANWMPGWQAPVQIGPPIGSSWSESNISLAADASGAVIAVWPAINGSVQGGALLTNRYDPATGWGSPGNAGVIHTANGVHRTIALAVDKNTSNGRAAALWVDVATYRIFASIFDPLIGTWGPAEAVSDPNGVYLSPQVSVDRNGTIRAVWAQNNSILSSERP